MEFKVNRSTHSRDGREFIAVPSHEGGAFVIDHGEHYGRRVYSEMELRVPENEREKARAGDFSASYARLQYILEQPGMIGPYSPWMLHVSITIPGSGNTVSHDVTEVQELMPYIPDEL